MRRLRRWLSPVALLVGSVGSAVALVAVESAASATAPPVGGADLATPVLSVRRLPTVVAAPIAERRLRADLEAWVSTQPPDTCLAVTGESDEGRAVSFDHNPGVPLTPASTAKLLTGAAALRELGADQRFRTVVAATTPPDGGVVAGDLVLVGGGDPLLASPDYAARYRRQPQTFTNLDELARVVVATGIRRVDGAVVGDEGRYDGARYVASWPQRYIDQDQVGPLSALSVNDGFAAYPTSPDVFRELEPATDPAANAAAVFTRLLEAHGVDVAGGPRAGGLPTQSIEVAAIESPPMHEVVAQLLRESDNSTGELLLKEVGRTVGDASTAGGRVAVTASLAEAGVDVSGVVVGDGSGLGEDNKVTCAALLDLLTGTVLAPSLDDGLAVAGRTGTLAERFAGTELEGVLRAKTGSLNTVTALAGIVDDDDPPLAFALLVNVPAGSRVPKEVVPSQEALAEMLRAWPRVPDVDVLGPRPIGEDGGR